MSVAVVIPCWNNGRTLHRTLLSVFGQTRKPDEVILIDSDSRDGSLEVAKQWDVPVVTVPRSSAGFARNAGIAATKSEFILPLDADDWIDSDYLEWTVPMLANESLGVIATDLRWEDGRIQHPIPPFTVEHFRDGNLLFCCSLFRRVCWEQAGGYPEELAVYEDWLFWARIVSLGWKIGYLPKPLFHYCPAPGSSESRWSSQEHLALRKKTIAAIGSLHRLQVAV